jgi:ABC-type nickel/cobalt efflux system permease component RcnA
LSRKAKPWEPFAAGFLSAGLHAGSSLILIIIFKVIKKTVASFTSSELLAFYLEGWTFIALGFFALILIIIKIIEQHRTTAQAEVVVHSNKNIYGLLFVSSLFPCPGATMILLFALSEGLLTIGILGVVAMSIGMGTIISLVGYLAMTGREGLFRWFKNREDKVKSISDKLEITSYILVVLFALWMGSPFIYWLLTHSGVS